MPLHRVAASEEDVLGGEHFLRIRPRCRALDEPRDGMRVARAGIAKVLPRLGEAPEA